MVSLILTIAQIIISVLLITSVLLQQKGAGLSGAFGGSDAIFSSKRGADLILFRITIVLAALFIISGASRLFF